MSETAVLHNYYHIIQLLMVIFICNFQQAEFVGFKGMTISDNME